VSTPNYPQSTNAAARVIPAPIAYSTTLVLRSNIPRRRASSKLVTTPHAPTWASSSNVSGAMAF
jgi:hypothetical protein